MSDLDLDDELLGLAEGRDTTRRKSKSRQPQSKRKRAAASDDSAGSDMDMSADSDDEPSRKTRKKRRGSRSDDDDSEDDDDEGEGGIRAGSGRRRTARRFEDDDGDSAQGEMAEDDEADPTRLYPLENIYKDKADRDHIQSLPELDREAILGERAEQISEWNSRKALKEMVRMKERREAGGGSSDEEDSRRKGGRNRTTTGATKSKSDSLRQLREKRQQKAQRMDRRAREGDEDDEDDDEADRKAGYSSEEEAYSDESGDERRKKQKERKSKSKPVEVVNSSQLRDCFVTRAKLADFFLAPWFEDWVRGVKDYPDKPYKLEGRTTTKQLELSIAGSSRVFKMEFVSDSPFSDADIAAELAKKGPRVTGAAGKARLLVQRDFAVSSGNQEMLAAVNAELAKLDAPQNASGAAGAESEQDRMRRVNERNRLSNRTEIQRAEAVAQQERRRQEAALARGDTEVQIDPSARVKTLTRLKYDRDSRDSSRNGTPGPNPGSPTKKNAELAQADVAAADNARSKGSKFEEMVAAKVDIDIDLDF
ncbi:RNA polymerase-associated protein rtf1 [Microbotryomycetes sp. JL201]|nr:RNA polymerase-associated protein rtf1 [Microbotryomycetes sp. JL201]